MRAPDLRDAIEVRAPSTDEGQEHRECAKRTTNLMRGLPPMPRRKGPPPETSGRTGGGRVRAGGRRQTYPHEIGEERERNAKNDGCHATRTTGQRWNCRRSVPATPPVPENPGEASCFHHPPQRGRRCVALCL
jgi:hypothetical protein